MLFEACRPSPARIVASDLSGVPLRYYNGSRYRSRRPKKGRSAITTVLFGVLVVFLSVLFAVLGLTLVQRLIPSALREEHNDVAGFIYAVLGVLYAVVVAFVVIAVWEEFEAGRNTAETEAINLADVYRLADQFPEPKRSQVQDLARSYARVVIDEEWPLMRNGQSSPRASTLMYDLQQSILEFEPNTPAEEILYDQELSRVQDLAEARIIRLAEVEQGLPIILWGVLLVGGIITVGFTYLFGLRNTWSHMLMVATLTLVIALILFAIYSMQYAFSGDVRVHPDALELVLNSFDGRF